MPHYTLTVTRTDPNPLYDQARARECAELQARGYGNQSAYYNVPPTVETQTVLVALTEEQFNAVRRAVLEVAV